MTSQALVVASIILSVAADMQVLFPWSRNTRHPHDCAECAMGAGQCGNGKGSGWTLDVFYGNVNYMPDTQIPIYYADEDIDISFTLNLPGFYFVEICNSILGPLQRARSAPRGDTPNLLTDQANEPPIPPLIHPPDSLQLGVANQLQDGAPGLGAGAAPSVVHSASMFPANKFMKALDHLPGHADSRFLADAGNEELSPGPGVLDPSGDLMKCSFSPLVRDSQDTRISPYYPLEPSLGFALQRSCLNTASKENPFRMKFRIPRNILITEHAILRFVLVGSDTCCPHKILCEDLSPEIIRGYVSSEPGFYGCQVQLLPGPPCSATQVYKNCIDAIILPPRLPSIEPNQPNGYALSDKACYSLLLETTRQCIGSFKTVAANRKQCEDLCIRAGISSNIEWWCRLWDICDAIECTKAFAFGTCG